MAIYHTIILSFILDYEIVSHIIHSLLIAAVEIMFCRTVMWDDVGHVGMDKLCVCQNYLVCLLLRSDKKKALSYQNSLELNYYCEFPGRFEDANFSLKTKMKICSNFHWIMRMCRFRMSRMLKNENKILPHFWRQWLHFEKCSRLKIWGFLLKMQR